MSRREESDQIYLLTYRWDNYDYLFTSFLFRPLFKYQDVHLQSYIMVLTGERLLGVHLSVSVLLLICAVAHSMILTAQDAGKSLVSLFITSILKWLVILIIWWVISSAIYWRLCLFFSFSYEKATSKYNKQDFLKVTDHVVVNKILRLLSQKMMMIYDF